MSESKVIKKKKSGKKEHSDENAGGNETGSVSYCRDWKDFRYYHREPVI